MVRPSYGVCAVLLASGLSRARDDTRDTRAARRASSPLSGRSNQRGWLGYEVREAPPASREALVAVHSAEYVDAVRSISDRGGGAFDAETVLSPGSYRDAAHAAGAACAMVEALLAGEARVGSAPPGRPGTTRARTRRPDSASSTTSRWPRHAVDSLDARRVFVFDWDVHHGDGTNDIFRATNAVLFASIHESGPFPGTGRYRMPERVPATVTRSICRCPRARTTTRGCRCSSTS